MAALSRNTIWRAMAALPLLALPLSAAAQSAPAPGEGTAQATDPTRAFVDEFETLDPARWMMSDGWSNGDHQNCQWTADSVTLGNGLLRLTLSDRPAGGLPYSCAEVQSNARYGYGTFEARMRVPFYSGMNANFFTFIGAQQDAPHNEIDFEFIARDGPTLQTNLFLNGEGGREQLHRQSGDWAFRNYAIVWMPGLVQWFTDGQLVRELRGDAVPSAPQKVFFSLWSTGTLTDWLGPLDYPGQPVTLEVDRFAYTPEGAECAFDGALACVRPMEPGSDVVPDLPRPQMLPADLPGTGTVAPAAPPAGSATAPLSQPLP
jgi:endo-1,3-1,4-beta-glycanase ExoK